MILTLDIGNTCITAGLFQGKRLVKRCSTATHQAGFKRFLQQFSRHYVTAVVISGVVPQATDKLAKDLRAAFPGIKPSILGKNATVPVKNLYKYPKQAGQDRLVNAYAAIRLYGYPAIVVDFGTAITFDVISSRKEYKGGMILPGLQTSLDALADRTALLPKIPLARPSGLIGRDTKNSMLSGIVYGFASLTDRLTTRLSAGLGKNVMIIGTGGHISLIKRYCTCFTAIDPDLTLKGLNLLATR
ncbi:MAG TPA: type III pantothenate kinase [Candidatus Omnitrophota bacterium]|nr:type III pantothenate kinase [Candidatus Omnitrophota bacterium]